MAVPVPAGFHIETYFTPSGRERTRLQLMDTIDWEQVMGDLGTAHLEAYVRRVAGFVAQASGGGRASWPRLTGRSARSLRAGATERYSRAERHGYSRESGESQGAGLLIASTPWAKAVERGAYYDTGPFARSPWRRPTGRYILRLERRIRRAVLAGGDINRIVSGAVTQAWRKRVRNADRRARRSSR